MKTIYSIYDAKANLSRLLRQVKSGRHITIAERGTPIARVVPYEQPHSLAERFAYLRAQGIIRSRKRGKPKVLKKVRGGLRRFLEDRE
jgi:prevent-host-death family protein